MNFDPTITWGAVFIVLSQIGSMFWFVSRMDKRIDLMARDVRTLEKRIDALSVDMKETSRFGERFATLEGRVTNHGSMLANTNRDISDLRRGNGFISGPRASVDGEYP